jgi:hypothetical protein
LLQFCKIGFKFFKGVGSAFLIPENRWKSSSVTRGDTPIEDGAIEAEIEDVDAFERFAAENGEETFACLPSEDEGGDGDD